MTNKQRIEKDHTRVKTYFIPNSTEHIPTKGNEEDSERGYHVGDAKEFFEYIDRGMYDPRDPFDGSPEED